MSFRLMLESFLIVCLIGGIPVLYSAAKRVMIEQRIYERDQRLAELEDWYERMYERPRWTGVDHWNYGEDGLGTGRWSRPRA